MVKIIAFEGLGNLGYLKQGLIGPLERKYGEKILVTMYHHFQIPSGPCNIIIGHSLGGESAINHIKNLNPKPILLTLDPRRNSIASWFDILLPFQAPFDDVRAIYAYNFFRRGFMPGYEVKGAENVKLSCSHGGVPYQPEVFKLACKLIDMHK